MPCITIAEIGENHMGDMGLARRMICEAAEAGADIVKFQSYRSQTFRIDDPEYEWFQKVSLSDRDHFMLKEYAEGRDVEFMSAPCDMDRAEFLCEKLGTGRIKVSSGKMTDTQMLSYLNDHCYEIFLSTGMATLQEIKNSLSFLTNVKVYLLHCVSQYPLRSENANLKAIQTLKTEFPRLVMGYSDHTPGGLAPLIAVALGAEVIEKHFTLNKEYPEGTDHVLSATPTEFREMVHGIREVEKLLGDGLKEPRACEKEIVDFVRNRIIDRTN